MTYIQQRSDRVHYSDMFKNIEQHYICLPTVDPEEFNRILTVQSMENGFCRIVYLNL